MAAPVGIDPGNEGLKNLEALVATLPQEIPDGGKNIPIVLVPGFSCWGDPFFGTINYFGGFNDLPGVLVEAGYAVIMVRPGPLSSNWERACEIYAQLKNIAGNDGFDSIDDVPSRDSMVVDYGNEVGYGDEGSKFFDNDNNEDYPKRFRTSCPRALARGLEPNWSWGDKSPVHFVCHSQGGTSVRTLIELLSGRHQTQHPAFAGDRRNWVKSVVTLGTPHRGSTIIDVLKGLFENDDDLLKILGQVITSASFKDPGTRFYDVQLDHWGFKRGLNARGVRESFQEMYDRIVDIVSNRWISNRNGFYDNSTEGAILLDAFEANQTSPPGGGIYFFTMSFDATKNFPPIKIDPNDLKRFPLRWDIPFIPNPLDTFTGILSHFPGIKGGVPLAKWIVNIANNHLGQLGYFNRLPDPGPRIPRPDMLPVLAFTGYAMGGHDVPGSDWLTNDGIVNTISMQGPNGANIQDAALFSSKPDAVGVYWHFGRNQTMDHADQIGVFTDNKTYWQIEMMYKLFGDLLSRLP